MTDADLVRYQYSYDPETGVWLWRNPPAKAALSKAVPGSSAGSIDARDGARLLNLNGKAQRSSRLAWLYVYGEWPAGQVLYRDPALPLPVRDRLSNLRLAGTAEEMTPERIRMLLAYDPSSGTFRWRFSRKGVRAGAIAAGIKNTRAKSAYVYVRIDGVDYPAQRLAWLYVKGAWPGSRLSFHDGNARNCAIDNLFESGFEHGTRQNPEINDEDRRVRQAATFRRHDLKRRFALTSEQYQAMHDAQDSKCAICGQQETVTRNGRVRWLAVDHNHATQAVRDLLCNSCNIVVGHSRENPEILRAAALYLERHAAPDEGQERVA